VGIEIYVSAPEDPRWLYGGEGLRPSHAWVDRARYVGVTACKHSEVRPAPNPRVTGRQYDAGVLSSFRRPRATVRRLYGFGFHWMADRRARRFSGPAARWVPEYLVMSGWLEHAPFAFWLIRVANPRSIVELGTERGFSYLVFCQAIRDHGVAARASAVDTWAGDEHAGFYGDEVYTTLCRVHDPSYASFSTLIRSSFSDALPLFADGSVDLLHIDGLHTFDAVRCDFESWRPKLSDRAVVLLHDTNVHASGFGVDRYWAELSERYPSFEFLHGNGLGVLVVGTNPPVIVRELAEAGARPPVRSAIRRRYAALGSEIARYRAANT
jgi:hypothetical protein